MKRVTDHFDGRAFHNPTKAAHGLAGFLKWSLGRRPEAWTAPGARSVEPPSTVPARPASGEVVATFVNHATVLLQVDGLSILTDPIWSDRCSPVAFAGPKRYRAAGIAFESLPRIDLVLISHDHYDHLDVPTIERLLARNPATRFVTGLGNAALLRRLGARFVDELDWWERADACGLGVSFVPAEHFSGRGIRRNDTLWGGFVLHTGAGPVFFAGDTGYGPHFRAIRAAFGPMRLALLPIGAYAPRWYMAPVHMDPHDAVRAHVELEAEVSMGVHFGTFRLTDEAEDAPAADLRRALVGEGVSGDAFVVPTFGGSLRLAAALRASARL